MAPVAACRSVQTVLSVVVYLTLCKKPVMTEAAVVRRLGRQSGPRGRLDESFIHSVRSQLPIRAKHSDRRATVEALAWRKGLSQEALAPELGIPESQTSWIFSDLTGPAAPVALRRLLHRPDVLAGRAAEEHRRLGVKRDLGLPRSTLRTGHVGGGTSRGTHGNLVASIWREGPQDILLSLEGQQFTAD